MCVYVDSLIDYGWKFGPSCHLIADDLEELHAFALILGMKRHWFQDKSLPHYDLTATKRKLAVAKGAIEIGHREVVGKIKQYREKKKPA